MEMNPGQLIGSIIAIVVMLGLIMWVWWRIMSGGGKYNTGVDADADTREMKGSDHE